MKSIRDPIHEYISISDRENRIIDTAYFQRLRHIKQMSMANLVYPSALGSRFEHSLGVMHLAGEFLSSLHENSKMSETWKEWEQGAKKVFGNSLTLEHLREIVRLAGLLHDVGHLPFSHTFERFIVDYGVYDRSLIPETSDRLFPHEEASFLITKEILGPMLGDDLDHVLNVLCPPKIGSPREEFQTYMFLHSVWKSQLDADKLDYVLRDAYMSGAGFGKYDLSRIFLNIYITNVMDIFTPAPSIRALSAIDSTISERYRLHQWVYFHPVVVMLDELVRRVTGHFAKEDEGLRSLLHFHNYVHNGSSFDDVFLLQYFRNQCSDQACESQIRDYLRAICRRERLPVPLWKDLLVFKSINDDVARYIETVSGGEEPVEYPLNMLVSFTDVEIYGLENTINSRIKEGETILATRMFTPYRRDPVKSIRILDRDGKPEELRKVSSLVQGLIQYWNTSPQVYAFVTGDREAVRTSIEKYQQQFVKGVEEWIEEYCKPDPEGRLAVFLRR